MMYSVPSFLLAAENIIVGFFQLSAALSKYSCFTDVLNVAFSPALQYKPWQFSSRKHSADRISERASFFLNKYLTTYGPSPKGVFQGGLLSSEIFVTCQCSRFTTHSL
jgi:hypothetical protein